MNTAAELAEEINRRGRFTAIANDHVVKVIKLATMQPCSRCGGTGHVTEGADEIVFDKVMVDPDRQVVTFGNGSGIGTSNVEQWLTAIHS